MAEIKVGKNETLTVRCSRFKRATQKAMEFFLKLEAANIMKNRAFNVRKNPKQPENVKPDNGGVLYVY